MMLLSIYAGIHKLQTTCLSATRSHRDLTAEPAYLCFAAGVGVCAVSYAAARYIATRVPSSGPYPEGSLPADAYDVVIVGGESTATR